MRSKKGFVVLEIVIYSSFICIIACAIFTNIVSQRGFVNKYGIYSNEYIDIYEDEAEFLLKFIATIQENAQAKDIEITDEFIKEQKLQNQVINNKVYKIVFNQKENLFELTVNDKKGNPLEKNYFDYEIKEVKNDDETKKNIL